MALQDQELAVGFGQGLDKKSDPKAVVPGKFLMLENAVFSEAHQVAKRYGYDSLTLVTYSPFTGTTGTLAAPKMVKSYNDEIVCADSGRLYSYSPTLASWVDKGPYESIASTKQIVSGASTKDSQSFQSCAQVGKYLLVTWQQNYDPASGNSVFATIIDTETGAKIYPETAIVAGTLGLSTKPIAVVLGGTTLAVAYFSVSSQLYLSTFALSGNKVTLSAPVSIGSGVANSPDLFSGLQFDIAPTSTGCVAAFYNGTNVHVVTTDTTGTVTHTATGFTGTCAMSITVGSNGNIWVYGCTLSGAAPTTGTYKYIVYSSTLSVVLASTTIGTLTGGSITDTFVPLAVVAVADSVTQQSVIYNGYDPETGQDPALGIVNKIVTVTGTVTAGTFIQAYFSIISKPFYIGVFRYCLLLRTGGGSTAGFDSTDTGVYLYNLDTIISTRLPSKTGAAVAKSLWGEAGNPPLGGFVPAVSFKSVTEIVFPFGILTQSLTDGGVSGGSAANAVTVYSTTLLDFNWNHQDAYQSVVFNEQLVLGGGIPSLYDGAVCAEAGFLDSPGIASAAGTGNAGNIADGTRLYVAIFQWIDNKGNLHQSSGSAVVNATNSSGTTPTTYSINVYCPLVSLKDPELAGVITVALYRTTNGGSLFFQVGHQAITPTPGAAVLVTFVDNVSDTNLAGCTPLYSTGNILFNDPPPPCLILNTHNNRVWLLDSTNPLSIWYSKTAVPTVGLSMSGDLTATIDAKGGDISGLAELDDKEIVFKSGDRVAVLYGDGANDTGAGSTLSNPQFVQTDVGCSASKSILSQPNGLLFKSPKGWYQMDRSTQVSYIGFPVETYNSQDVTSAIRVKDKTLCVFLTSSGSALAYDYFFNQWSTFTNHTGYSADIFQGKYTYVRTGGGIYQQNTSTYLDGATTYLLRAQTSWLNLGKIQNFQRVRQVFALGDHLSPVSGHGLQISAAYDFISTFSTPVVYTFSGAGTDPFQYREHLSRQKCDTVSLLIEEVSAAPGTSGEYIDLTDLGFEAGMKKGPNKLSAAKSVG